MSCFVVDCSVTMSWCFEDEADAYADAALEAMVEGNALVPSIWPLEVANVLLSAERRGRLREADTVRFLELLRGLPIEVDGETPRRAMGEILALGRERGLSAYDAAYLELAMRESLALASRDRALVEAALRCGVARATFG